MSGTGSVNAWDGIDRSYLVTTLSRLATVPTDVPMGYDTLMEPDDPKLVHYVQRVLRPNWSGSASTICLMRHATT